MKLELKTFCVVVALILAVTAPCESAPIVTRTDKTLTVDVS